MKAIFVPDARRVNSTLRAVPAPARRATMGRPPRSPVLWRLGLLAFALVTATQYAIETFHAPQGLRSGVVIDDVLFQGGFLGRARPHDLRRRIAAARLATDRRRRRPRRPAPLERPYRTLVHRAGRRAGDADGDPRRREPRDQRDDPRPQRVPRITIVNYLLDNISRLAALVIATRRRMAPVRPRDLPLARHRRVDAGELVPLLGAGLGAPALVRLRVVGLAGTRARRDGVLRDQLSRRPARRMASRAEALVPVVLRPPRRGGALLLRPALFGLPRSRRSVRSGASTRSCCRSCSSGRCCSHGIGRRASRASACSGSSPRSARSWSRRSSATSTR